MSFKLEFITDRSELESIISEVNLDKQGLEHKKSYFSLRVNTATATFAQKQAEKSNLDIDLSSAQAKLLTFANPGPEKRKVEIDIMGLQWRLAKLENSSSIGSAKAAVEDALEEAQVDSQLVIVNSFLTAAQARLAEL